MTKKKIRENHKNNIILIGFMGCGKSTIGKLLSKKLNKPLVDTDALIEKKEGMSISKIFELKGEVYFRNLEKECLKALSLINDTIISVGGGMPCNADNMIKLNSIGTSIYIKVGKSELANRLLKDKTRPILHGMDSIKELEIFISRKLRERRVYYEQANITIMGNSSIKDIISRISKKI